MGTDDGLASPDTAIDNAVEPFSALWWRGRSTEELRSLIAGGFGTAGFEEASLEAERRARERRRIEDEAERAKAARNRTVRRVILEGLLVAALLALIATELMR